MSAPVVRWQIVSPDPERAAAFYSKAFGWAISRHNGLGYREVRTAASGIDGGIWPASPGQPSMVQLFLAVPDLDLAIANAVAEGASVIVPKTVLPDGDAMAILLDPTGQSVGICTLRHQG